jgi:hypothetical protein
MRTAMSSIIYQTFINECDLVRLAFFLVALHQVLPVLVTIVLSNALLYSAIKIECNERDLPRIWY